MVGAARCASPAARSGGTSCLMRRSHEKPFRPLYGRGHRSAMSLPSDSIAKTKTKQSEIESQKKPCLPSI
jgi:hypothetical protein